MRYGSTARRMRNGSNSNPGGQRGGSHAPQQRRGIQNKNKVFDSNGPDVRIRGTAYQIVEKYQALAKDAGSAGDRVLAENYLQYAEHYQRMINGWEEEDAYYESIDVHGADDLQNNTQNSVLDVSSSGHPQRDSARTQNQRMRHEQRSQVTRSVEGDLAIPASILGQATVATSSIISSTAEAQVGANADQLAEA